LTPATENYRESLEKQYKTLQRYEYVIKEGGGTEEGVKDLIADMKKIEKRLIAEKSDFLAAAFLQREISALTGKTNMNVATIRPLSAVKLNDYSVIPVYFEGNANIKQVSEFLKLIESNPIMLKIDKLSLNITNMQKPDDLRFKIQISGLSRI
jgi:hypothetical protein